MEWLDDADNVNMAQAFVLYGLAEYARLNDSPEVRKLIDEQVDFIQTTLKDSTDPYYLDGFNEQWARGQNMTRAFATHFHTMEALLSPIYSDPFPTFQLPKTYGCSGGRGGVLWVAPHHPTKLSALVRVPPRQTFS